MLRDRLFSEDYFSEWIDFIQKEQIDERKTRFDFLTLPEGKAGASSSLWWHSVELTFMRYSRGDAIPEMRSAVLQMIEMLQIYRSTLTSLQLDEGTRKMYERLDLYKFQQALALLAFMVSLHFSISEIQRVLALIGHAGKDVLLDRVAHHFGDTDREIAECSRFPKLYNALAAVIDAPSERQSGLLKKYVEGWYKRMKPAAWHDNHKKAEGAYVGYWCFEAALVAMLWNIDDSALAEHEHYPYDLVCHYCSRKQ